MKRRIDDCWEFTPHWSEEFLQGAKGEQQVRIPHTVKEIPLHYADPSSYQMIAGYRRVVRIPEEEKGRRHFLQFDAAAAGKVVEHMLGLGGDFRVYHGFHSCCRDLVLRGKRRYSTRSRVNLQEQG